MSLKCPVAKCPAGHDSTSDDFCSECGLEMVPPPGAVPKGHSGAPSPGQGAGADQCPGCGTERDAPEAVFCGVCGYNFATGAGGDTIADRRPEDVQPQQVRPPTVAAKSPESGARSKMPHIDIEVTFDQSKEDAPKGAPTRKFSLYDEESLIGRRSNSVTQTAGLAGDDFISRRHLLIIRQPDGSYVARLFDNTNGATLNGTEMTAGVEMPIAEGDTIQLGAFTVLRITAIR
jgi:hypothetical protein